MAWKPLKWTRGKDGVHRATLSWYRIRDEKGVPYPATFEISRTDRDPGRWEITANGGMVTVISYRTVREAKAAAETWLAPMRLRRLVEETRA
jgi:hypothetical protein